MGGNGMGWAVLAVWVPVGCVDVQTAAEAEAGAQVTEQRADPERKISSSAKERVEIQG